MIWRGRRGGATVAKPRPERATPPPRREFAWEQAIDDAVRRARNGRRAPSETSSARQREPGTAMRIAAFADATHPSSNYRALHPLAELMRRGHDVALHATPGELALGDAEAAALAEEFDVAFVVRYLQREGWQLARRLTRAGLPVVWDYDDDVYMPQQVAQVRSMVHSVTLMTTTSNALAKRHRQRGARNVLAVPNYLTIPSVRAERREHDGIVLGYIGWIDHQLDWDRLRLRDTVRDLMDAHPHLRVESVGPIDLRLPPQRYQRFDVLPFEQLPQAIARFDIAIAPLAQKPGNATRSDIKLKEYAILGVPWLASPMGPYVGLGEEQGGRLVPNRGWGEAIDALVRDADAREELGRRGTAWASEQTLERNGGDWERAFETAIERMG